MAKTTLEATYLVWSPFSWLVILVVHCIRMPILAEITAKDFLEWIPMAIPFRESTCHLSFAIVAEWLYLYCHNHYRPLIFNHDFCFPWKFSLYILFMPLSSSKTKVACGGNKLTFAQMERHRLDISWHSLQANLHLLLARAHYFMYCHNYRTYESWLLWMTDSSNIIKSTSREHLTFILHWGFVAAPWDPELRCHFLAGDAAAADWRCGSFVILPLCTPYAYRPWRIMSPFRSA